MIQSVKQVAFSSSNLLELVLLTTSRILHLRVNSKMFPVHQLRREIVHLFHVVQSISPIKLVQKARTICRLIAVEFRVNLLVLKLVLRVKDWVPYKSRFTKMPAEIQTPGTLSR